MNEPICEKTKISVLFVCPHPDDELLLGGGMLVRLARDAKYKVHIYIATNGDYVPGQGGIRIVESINALRLLGIEREAIFFGGYGDNCESRHLYDASPNEVCPSLLGKRTTYAPTAFKSITPYFRSLGREYTRNNYKLTLRELLRSLRPELIFCVGQDRHPDHKALSLVCEECICELVKGDPKFRPCLLTKPVYDGVYFGEKDYFVTPHRPTKCNNRLPFYGPKEAVRYTVPKECNTESLFKNTLYKMATKYKSQRLRERAAGFINSDIVYWPRHTTNLALFASVTASSGKSLYINDFKLLERHNVMSDSNNYLGWSPDKNDLLRTVCLSFTTHQSVFYINLYVLNTATPNSVEVHFDGQVIAREIKGGGPLPIELSMPISCKSVLFSFKNEITIGEIELFSSKPLLPLPEYLAPNILDAKKEKAHRIRSFVSYACNGVTGQVERVINIYRRWLLKRKVQ